MFLKHAPEEVIIEKISYKGGSSGAVCAALQNTCRSGTEFGIKPMGCVSVPATLTLCDLDQVFPSLDLCLLGVFLDQNFWRWGPELSRNVLIRAAGCPCKQQCVILLGGAGRASQDEV